MAMPGRNDPCPCGSGKKYKRCCLDKDKAEQSARLAAMPRTSIPEQIAGALATHYHDGEDELSTQSNAAVDLVNAGKLDEAERIAHDLLQKFPDVHDGWDRLGMVYEARGENQKAADCYRKVIDFAIDHPDQYDPGFVETFRRLVRELDPTIAP
jgi:tetratricopeptide (TPR) repeat protein